MSVIKMSQSNAKLLWLWHWSWSLQKSPPAHCPPLLQPHQGWARACLQAQSSAGTLLPLFTRLLSLVMFLPQWQSERLKSKYLTSAHQRKSISSSTHVRIQSFTRPKIKHISALVCGWDTTCVKANPQTDSRTWVKNRTETNHKWAGGNSVGKQKHPKTALWCHFHN